MLNFESSASLRRKGKFTKKYGNLCVKHITLKLSTSKIDVVLDGFVTLDLIPEKRLKKKQIGSVANKFVCTIRQTDRQRCLRNTVLFLPIIYRTRKLYTCIHETVKKTNTMYVLFYISIKH